MKHTRDGLSAIVFDFDGVIVDSERLHVRSYQQVLAPRRLTLSDADYFAHYFGYDDATLLRRYARDRGLAWDDDEMAGIVAEKTVIYERLAAAGEMVFPGAAQFIRAAAAAVPIAIASGALTHEIEEILDRAQLRSLFPTIVGADQTMRSKPSPDPYLEACHRLRAAGHEIALERTVAIEDSMWGLVSARTAGLRTIGVTTTCEAEELAPHAELIVAGLESLSLERLDAFVAAPIAESAMRTQPPQRGTEVGVGTEVGDGGSPGAPRSS